MSTIWNMSLFTKFSMSLNFRWFRCKSCSSGRKPSLSSEEDIYVPKDPFKKRCLRSVFIFVYFLLAVVAVVVTYAMVQVCTCSIISIQDCVLVSSYHWSFAEKIFVKQSMILECAQKLSQTICFGLKRMGCFVGEGVKQNLTPQNGLKVHPCGTQAKGLCDYEATKSCFYM